MPLALPRFPLAAGPDGRHGCAVTSPPGSQSLLWTAERDRLSGHCWPPAPTGLYANIAPLVAYAFFGPSRHRRSGCGRHDRAGSGLDHDLWQRVRCSAPLFA